MQSSRYRRACLLGSPSIVRSSHALQSAVPLLSSPWCRAENRDSLPSLVHENAVTSPSTKPCKTVFSAATHWSVPTWPSFRYDSCCESKPINPKWQRHTKENLPRFGSQTRLTVTLVPGTERLDRSHTSYSKRTITYNNNNCIIDNQCGILWLSMAIIVAWCYLTCRNFNVCQAAAWWACSPLFHARSISVLWQNSRSSKGLQNRLPHPLLYMAVMRILWDVLEMCKSCWGLLRRVGRKLCKADLVLWVRGTCQSELQLRSSVVDHPGDTTDQREAPWMPTRTS